MDTISVLSSVIKKNLNENKLNSNYDIKAYQAMGSTIVAQTVGVDAMINSVNGAVLVEAQAEFVAVWLDKAQTITGVKWYQTVAGNYTGDNYNGVGLYSYSGGTITLVASSTNDANIWKATANTVGSKAFTTPYSAQPNKSSGAR